MKIKLENIKFGGFDIRDDFREEQVKQLSKSLEEDGQWNPVIVRPLEDGKYELISGHYRIQAAQKVDWEEIEATVKDADDEEALFLAMKTNLMRQDMEQKEQGEVLNQMLDEYGINQSEMGKKLGKSVDWVNRRLKLAMDLCPELARLLENDIISNRKAIIISSKLDEKQQKSFLNFSDGEILNKKTEKDLRNSLNRFLNDTLYTIGYEGKNWEAFLSELKDNDIKILLDVRKSAKSPNKTTFSSEMLKERLDNKGIQYIHRDKLGVDFSLQEPYKNDFIGDKCFKDWYYWWIKEKSEIDMESLTEYIKNNGKTALMCYEKFAEPKEKQSIFCHRYHLAQIIKNIEIDNKKAFEKIQQI